MVEFRSRVEDRESCACGALGVVVMRLGPAEIRHDAVAEVFGDVPAESRDRFCCRAMVSRDYLAPFLGIKLR